MDWVFALQAILFPVYGVCSCRHYHDNIEHLSPISFPSALLVFEGCLRVVTPNSIHNRWWLCSTWWLCGEFLAVAPPIGTDISDSNFWTSDFVVARRCERLGLFWGQNVWTWLYVRLRHRVSGKGLLVEQFLVVHSDWRTQLFMQSHACYSHWEPLWNFLTSETGLPIYLWLRGLVPILRSAFFSLPLGFDSTGVGQSEINR